MLRDYQQSLNERTIKHLEKNDKCCVSLATGAGKTFTFIALAKELKGKTLILVNRIELVQQTIKSISDYGLFATPIIAQSKKIRYSEYSVGMTQTIQSRFKSGKFDYNQFDNIIIDECFPAGTQVDGKNIEDIRIGDYVRSFNHKKNKIEFKKVTFLFKKEIPNELIKINLNGVSFECTKNHPIFVKNKGYVRADKIKKGDRVKMHKVWGKNEKCKLYLQKLVGKVKDIQKQRKSFLYSRMSNNVLCKISFRKNEDKKPYAQRRYTKKNVSNLKKNRSQTPNSRREWLWNDRSSTKITKRIIKNIKRLVSRNDSNNRGRVSSTSLQNRHRKPCFKNSNRSRWFFSLFAKKKRARLKKRQVFTEEIVQSIEIQKSGSNGEYAIGDKKGYVYNIEVEDNNNYFVKDILVHNCHRLDYAIAHEEFNGKIIGFTATPIIEKKETYVNELGVKISKKIPLSKYYDTLIEGVDIKYLIDNNFLVQEKVFESKHFNESALKVDQKTGDYSTKSQNDLFSSQKSYEELYSIISEKAKGKKTIIFNATAKVNESVYNNLKQQGYPVKMYDSVNSESKERSKIVQWFKDTEGAILCNVNVFTTGFDVKEVECIVLNRSTMSLSLFLQMVGRGGRITDKIYKPYFTLIDLGGNVSGRSNSFGNWSDERDWKEHFYDDSEREVYEKNEDPKMCKECGALINPKATVCEYCGAEQKKKSNVKKQISSSDLVQTKKPKPNTASLLAYCEKNSININKARKLFAQSVAEMFEDTPQNVYKGHLKSGYLVKKLNYTFRDDYFAIQRSKLEGSRNRKLDTFIDNILTAIEKYYEKE